MKPFERKALRNVLKQMLNNVEEKEIKKIKTLSNGNNARKHYSAKSAIKWHHTESKTDGMYTTMTL